MFGERLKLARKSSGLSLRSLASRIGGIISAQAIGKYERGQMMPGSVVCIALSKALGVSMNYLLSPSEVSVNGVEFRKPASTRVRDRAKVQAAVLDHVDRYLQVEELAGIDNSRWDRPAKAPFPVFTLEDAERAAEQVRTAWNLGGNPIPNMAELLEGHGVKVQTLNFLWSIDGLSCNVCRPGRHSVPVVVCSGSKSVEGQRFTLARELAHMILDVGGDLDETKACRRFAGALLAPEMALVAGVGTRRRAFGYTELIQVKQMFGISAVELVARLRDLGIINDGVLRKIRSGIGRGWRRSEPDPLEPAEVTGRFRRLCYRALAEGAVSESKAAELLGLRRSEIDRTMRGVAA